jgi:hypothetical protein
VAESVAKQTHREQEMCGPPDISRFAVKDVLAKQDILIETLQATLKRATSESSAFLAKVTARGIADLGVDEVCIAQPFPSSYVTALAHVFVHYSCTHRLLVSFLTVSAMR